MAQKPFVGVYAAMLTPRTARGRIDMDALARLVRFLMAKGVSSFALNGATGEFCLTTPEELRTILRTVRETSEGRGRILCGVGSAGSEGAVALARIAEDEGVDGLLLPMPYFFRYEQDDLELFSRTVARSTELPALLYNLPQFSSGLEKETVRRLILDVPNIVGIKDSSGSLDILRDLTANGVEACRIVGNDGVLAQAREEGVCDGVVSGVACALPELVTDLYRNPLGSDEFRRSTRLMEELLSRLGQFPAPWGVKWAVEARGVVDATFSQPMTKQRLEQGREFIVWLRQWLTDALG